jgi:hypothetical protein
VGGLVLCPLALCIRYASRRYHPAYVVATRACQLACRHDSAHSPGVVVSSPDCCGKINNRGLKSLLQKLRQADWPQGSIVRNTLDGYRRPHIWAGSCVDASPPRRDRLPSSVCDAAFTAGIRLSDPCYGPTKMNAFQLHSTSMEIHRRGRWAAKGTMATKQFCHDQQEGAVAYAVPP